MKSARLYFLDHLRPSIPIEGSPQHFIHNFLLIDSIDNHYLNS